MSIYIDVWHRIHPLTPDNHRRFLDYYGEWVVAPPSDFFEVVAGFRFADGATNEDFALYRYDSMASIEASMMSFGADPGFQAATDALFSEIEIEETRGVAIHLPHSSEDRIDGALAASPSSDAPARRFVRSVRSCPGSGRAEACDGLAAVAAAVEKTGEASLVAAFEYLVGPVMDLVEIWCLAPGGNALDGLRDGTSPGSTKRLSEIAPERERRSLVPTDYSRLR